MTHPDRDEWYVPSDQPLTSWRRLVLMLSGWAVALGIFIYWRFV